MKLHAPARRRWLVALAASLPLAFPAARAAAQAWPDRPVKLIVSFPPGSPPDIIGRTFAQHLGEGLGQPVVVENRPGVGGTLGAHAAASASPDGYTLHLGTTGSLAVGPALHPKAGFDPIEAFVAISQISSAPGCLVVNASLPVTDVRSFVEYVRARPGKVNYSSVGSGSVPHILMEMFKARAGVDMVHVAYKNIPEAYQGVLSGDTVAVMDQPATAGPHLRAGKVRMLAVVSSSRHPDHPGVPTMAEAGIRDLEASLWFGLVAPRGTPPAIVKRLNDATSQALAVAPLRARFAGLSTDPAGSSPEAFGAFIAAEVKKWGAAVRASGAKVD